MKTPILTLLSLITVLVLSGCGGGGSSSSAPENNEGNSATGSNTGINVNGNLATSVPSPIYANGSAALEEFNELNSLRLAGNFGMLAQDTLLDASTSHHAAYLSTNYYNSVTNGWNNAAIDAVDPGTSELTGHIENSSLPGFTGVAVSDRATAAGATYASIGEVIAFQRTACISVLIDTVFHRAILLDPDLQTIGITIAVTPDNQSAACVIDMGYKTLPSITPPGWVGIYPGSGQTSVPIRMFSAEVPDPASNIPNNEKGYPISIFTNQAIKQVTSFTITAQGANIPVPAVIITSASLFGQLTNQAAFLLPTQHLEFNTTYSASFTGTLANGTTLQKTWSFTTTAFTPLTLQLSSTDFSAPGSIIVATPHGGIPMDTLVVQAIPYYYPTTNNAPTPVFFNRAYSITPEGNYAITLTRTNTPCNGAYAGCELHVVAQDQLGNQVEQTIPFN